MNRTLDLTVPMQPARTTVQLSHAVAEPFRLFFPMGVLTGLVGVALWPLFFGGWISFYPGIAHTRLMGNGFFGAFIIGFLGTALPRMLGARPMSLPWLMALLIAFITMLVAHSMGRIAIGDCAFITVLILLASFASTRWRQRDDLPPPGFVMAGLGIACGMIGTAIGITGAWMEMDPRWNTLRSLLSFQGFLLLPVLGVGAFILPRFFGQSSTHDLPESVQASALWKQRALKALIVGLAVIATFLLETIGQLRIAYALRFIAIAYYLMTEIPWRTAKGKGSTIGMILKLSLLMILAGLPAVALFPQFKVALLHITLVGGLAMVTLIVATRVILGHSGNGKQLMSRNRWLWVAWGLMILGMATRISGDMVPHIMVSHYNYGVLSWALGILLWSVYILPKVLTPDSE